MCFPSKWLKKNFSDEDKPRASGSEPAKTAEKPTSKPADKPAPNGTTVSTKERSRTFKTAIVIYTMYGHIASRESRLSTISYDLPASVTDFLRSFVSTHQLLNQ